MFGLALALAAAAHDPGALWLTRVLGQTVTAECRAELTPDRAVIQGGIGASSLKPVAAAAELERQLAEIRKLAGGAGGTLVLLERVRAVRPQPRDPARPERDLSPFLAVQRFELELPAQADVDRVLEELLRVGLDHYGPDLQLDADGRFGARPSGESRILVRYRFSRLREELGGIHDRCRRAAREAWCETQAGAGEQRVCAEALAGAERRFTTQAFSLVSQPVLRGPGPPAPVVLGRASTPARSEGLMHFEPLPLPAPGEVELLGLVTLRLRGAIALCLTVPRP